MTLPNEILGLELSQYIKALLVIVGLFAIQWLLQSVIFRGLKRVTDQTNTTADDILIEAARYPLRVLTFSLALLMLIDILNLPESLGKWLFKPAQLGFILAGTWFCSGATQLLTLSLSNWLNKRGTPLDEQIQPLLTRVLRVLVWMLGVLMLIQNLGYSVTGIIASLGIGGAAIAFASQDTIANVFGSAKVLLDRPFVIGDWIKSTDASIEGVVEDIGFLSTRIRTFADTQISVPNNKIANLALENFSRMTRRRIYTQIGLSYDTQIDQIQEIIPRMRALLVDHPEIDQETIFVNFTTFSESSLDIMVYFFTKTTNWGEWLRIREGLYLKFMEIIRHSGAHIAVPARQLRVNQLPDAALQHLASLETQPLKDLSQQSQGPSVGTPGDDQINEG